MEKQSNGRERVDLYAGGRIRDLLRAISLRKNLRLWMYET
jgi:hypothetical protein